MPENKHPLTNNPKWVFNQPNLGFRARYVVADEEGKREVRLVQTATTCREGVINNLRQAFQGSITNAEEYARSKAAGWSDKARGISHKVVKRVDLQAPDGKVESTSLKIQWHAHYMSGWDDFPIEKFLQVCDVVMGPVMVLLGPHRPTGSDWWRSNIERSVVPEGSEKYVHWYGSDNWFLAHPVTLSIVTGLYRQCFHLCGAGLADEIIATLTQAEIDEVMSTNSQRLALNLIKRTRQYIEVPAGTNGNRVNYPFAMGFWRRLIRLQRAIRRVGYEEALGQNFASGWNVISGQGEWRGVYNFWGDEGELTDNHRHLMRIGAPRRKQSGEKVADRSS